MTKKTCGPDIVVVPLTRTGDMIEQHGLKKIIKDMTRLDGHNFWYLHGYLQDRFGFDKALMFVNPCVLRKYGEYDFESNRVCLKTGIYSVTVYGILGDCTAFLWTEKHNGMHYEGLKPVEAITILQRGVVVLNGDTEAYKYGKSLFRRKPIAY